MKANRDNEQKLASLRRELDLVRRSSLLATRRGDFMRVAKLTSHAASINRAIMDAEGLSSIDLEL